MSRHYPRKEDSIKAFIAELKPGQEFYARDVAKRFNMTSVEAGNLLKMQKPAVRKNVQRYNLGTSWVKEPA